VVAQAAPEGSLRPAVKECIGVLTERRLLGATLWHPAKVTGELGMKRPDLGLPATKSSQTFDVAKVTSKLEHSGCTLDTFTRLFNEVASIWREAKNYKAAQPTGSTLPPLITEHERSMILYMIQIAPEWASNARNNESAPLISAIVLELLHVRYVRRSLLTETKHMRILRQAMQNILAEYTHDGIFTCIDGLDGLPAVTEEASKTFEDKRVQQMLQVSIATYAERVARVNRSQLIDRSGAEHPDVMQLVLSFAQVEYFPSFLE